MYPETPKFLINIRLNLNFFKTDLFLPVIKHLFFIFDILEFLKLFFFINETLDISFGIYLSLNIDEAIISLK